MHLGLFLALGSALLTHALPTSPTTNSNKIHPRVGGWIPNLAALLTHAPPTSPTTNSDELHPRDFGWIPSLPYPPHNNAATCPINPGPNPWANNLSPSKRSLIASPSPLLATTSNIRRQPNPLCQQVASGKISNFWSDDLLGNTSELLLLAGATYVFSWAFSDWIGRITAWRNNGDGTWTDIQETGMNEGAGTMTLQMGAAAHVHFEIQVGVPHAISGQFVLFQTANGDVNPTPLLEPPPP